MFNSMKKVVQSVEKTWQNLASHAEQSSNAWDNEQNLYKRGILMNIHFLTDRVDVDTKIEALRKIGHLAYTGGPEASKCAGKSMDLIVEILSNIANPRSLRTQAARSLSEICKSHKDNATNFVKNGLSSVLGSLESTSDPRLTRWCIYTLVTGSVNSIPALKWLSTSDELPKILRKMAALSWNGWENNYANILLMLLGYTEDN
ncbi:armadillo-like helical domain-containing protein 2 [Anneissia japonica]|uniref:armadillo-like helical domain-containing protein 2 n=1 Tax=Anneissia japonica TaxID=1529436 RepID=UPI001425B2EC|nr:armadillo-like helical domain-containing protein 2 [Anneissia japonica]